MEMGKAVKELLEERFCKTYGKYAWVAISIYLKYEGVELEEPSNDIEELLEAISRLMGDREAAKRVLRVASVPMLA